MEVGIRELRDGLSRHIAAVRDGGTVTVTDHGRPVARIVPIDAGDPLERLILQGRVRPGSRSRTLPFAPIEAHGTVSDLIADQRR